LDGFVEFEVLLELVEVEFVCVVLDGFVEFDVLLKLPVELVFCVEFP
jgi:hypothetical protein